MEQLQLVRMKQEVKTLFAFKEPEPPDVPSAWGGEWVAPARGLGSKVRPRGLLRQVR